MVDNTFGNESGSESSITENLLRSMMAPDSRTNETRVAAKPGLKRKFERLSGQQTPLNSLFSARQRVCINYGPTEVIFVDGESGIGKTTLIERLQKEATAEGVGFLAKGKFDLPTTNKPYGGIVQAFTQICESVLQRPEAEDLKSRLQCTIHNDLAMVAALIPCLSPWVKGLPSSLETSHEKTVRLFPRFKRAFRLILRLAVSAARPLILILEDIHWADPDSIELILSFLADLDSKHILIILSRDNNHPISAALDYFVNRSQQVDWTGLKVSLVTVPRLGAEDMSILTSSWLECTIEETRNLSNLIAKFGGGNPFRTLQLVLLLQEEGLLSWNSLNSTWDLDVLRATNELPASTQWVVKRRITPLSDVERQTIIIATVYGYSFRASDVQAVLQEKAARCGLDDGIINIEGRLQFALQSATLNGLLERTKDNEYRFLHEDVYEAFVSSSTEKQYRELSRDVGELTLKQIGRGNSSDMLVYRAADSINHSLRLEDRNSDVKRVVALNLRAAETAMERCAFSTSIHFLEDTKGLLSDAEGDDDEVKLLAFSVNRALAEAYFCASCYKKAEKTVEEIIRDCTSAKDVVSARWLQMDTFDAVSRYDLGLKLCLSLLAELGERFPKRISKRQAMGSMSSAKRCLKSLSDDALIAFPETCELAHRTTLALLSMASIFSLRLKHFECFCVATTRMVVFVSKCGASGEAAHGIALYACLHAMWNSHQDAARFADISMKMFQRFKGHTHLARSLTLLSLYVLHWSRPFSSLEEPLSRARHLALDVGDVEWASISSLLLVQVLLNSDNHLFEVEEQMRRYCREMTDLGHQRILFEALPLWQGILNLMGRAEDPLILTGEAMNQDTILRGSGTLNHDGCELTMRLVRLRLACVFHAWDLGVELAGGLNSDDKIFHASYYSYNQKFFEALCYLQVDRKNGKKKFRHRALKIVRQLQKWVDGGTSSCRPHVHLLQAEIASALREKNGLKKQYDKAIAAATEVRCLGIKALANDLAGRAFVSYDDYLADQYFSEALEYYFRWGAMSKVDKMETEHQSLRSRPKVVESHGSSKGSKSKGSNGRSRRSGGSSRSRGSNNKSYFET